jgi:predicted peptidase
MSCAAVAFSLAVSAFAADSAVPDPKPGAQIPATFTQTVTRTDQFSYLLYTPADYGVDTTKQWPLVLFLHGAGERGSELDKVTVHGPPKLVKQGRNFPFILVSPQCPDDQRWQADALIGLLDGVQAKLRVDPKRVYVTGLSMGGYGSWSLASRYPERFAAVAPICGGGERIDILLAGRRGPALKTLGIWAFHGAKDNVVPLNESERMVDAFKKAGNTDVKLTVYPEAGHDSWTEAYNTAELFEWLLKHSR